MAARSLSKYLSVLAVLLLTLSPEVSMSDPIKIDSGLISGATISEEIVGNDIEVRVYRGIPYAASTAGENRWRPPQPVAPWDGVRACTEFGDSCLFAAYGPESLWHGKLWSDVAQQSEDCLHLNVWTAAKSTDEKRPVMVYIHGGGLTRESGSVPAYGGTILARKGVVVVTINYRLGPFGFMAHPELSKESPHRSSGNYGILDQIAALRWLQRSIGAFGGDPDNVTIFGESAGSWSVCILTASPLAKGLFQKGIGQSGGGFGPMLSLQEAEQGGLALAKKIGSEEKPASLEQLRALSAQDLLDNYSQTRGRRTNINVDGWVLPDEVRTIFQQGKQNQVDVIVGSNQDEGSTFVEGWGPDTLQKYQNYAQRTYGDLAERFLKVYPASNDAEARKAFVASVGDSWFSWDMRTWARQAKTANAKAYLYYFTRLPPDPQTSEYGAYHGAEIIYVMGNFQLASFTPEPTDQRLHAAMSSYWINFAKSGDPNGVGLPQWPVYDSSSEYYLELGETIQVGQHLLKPQCDFFYDYNSQDQSEP
jgi:para-nitrobenzyl esterase